jgi:hypothetical protein
MIGSATLVPFALPPALPGAAAVAGVSSSSVHGGSSPKSMSSSSLSASAPHSSRSRRAIFWPPDRAQLAPPRHLRAASAGQLARTERSADDESKNSFTCKLHSAVSITAEISVISACVPLLSLSRCSSRVSCDGRSVGACLQRRFLWVHAEQSFGCDAAWRGFERCSPRCH